MYYTEDQLITMMSRAAGFVKVPDDYHIIGISSTADNPNQFDDVFNLMLGNKLILTTTGTTNPGTPILQGGYKKYNNDGAAIVEANRVYYNLWKYGKHLGKIPALLQLGAAVTIWRDGDGDTKSEEIGKRTTGWYGINFHADQYDIEAADKNSNAVGGWSAGCQVCNNMADYKKIIATVKAQKTVTYTLLKEFSI